MKETNNQVLTKEAQYYIDWITAQSILENLLAVIVWHNPSKKDWDTFLSCLEDMERIEKEQDRDKIDKTKTKVANYKIWLDLLNSLWKIYYLKLENQSKRIKLEIDLRELSDIINDQTVLIFSEKTIQEVWKWIKVNNLDKHHNLLD